VDSLSTDTVESYCAVARTCRIQSYANPVKRFTEIANGAGMLALGQAEGLK
jgi:hypothetical protein